jgi:hypothetical protein
MSVDVPFIPGVHVLSSACMFTCAGCSAGAGLGTMVGMPLGGHMAIPLGQMPRDCWSYGKCVFSFTTNHQAVSE